MMKLCSVKLVLTFKSVQMASNYSGPWITGKGCGAKGRGRGLGRGKGPIQSERPMR